MKVLRQIVRHARTLHTSSQCRAITNLNMPSMSPTMEQGTINRWSVNEGDSFSAGDVLLSIETDKAEIEVEAQDDGIMGKILKNDGAANIPVGQPIALLAEEGDDISNLESPKESSAEVSSGSSSQSAPATPEQPKPSPKEAPKQEAAPKTTTSHHSHSGLLPSVQRLLASSNLDLSKVKATGKSGRYTKGDILAALGQASSSTGTYTSEREKSITHIPIWGAKDRPVGASTAKKESKPLDARALRGLIIKGMSASYAVPQKKQEDLSFDSILDGYLPKPSPLEELQKMNEQRARKELQGKGIPLSSKDPMEELFVL